MNQSMALGPDSLPHGRDAQAESTFSMTTNQKLVLGIILGLSVFVVICWVLLPLAITLFQCIWRICKTCRQQALPAPKPRVQPVRVQWRAHTVPEPQAEIYI